MAENENNIDDLLNDIALEPDNDSNSSDELNSNNEQEESFEIQGDDLDENTDDEKDYSVQKKQNKIQKILISVVSGLGVLLVIGLIAYFIGFFDPDEEMSENGDAAIQSELLVEEKPGYDFKEKDIDIDRLNNKLNMLTKYEILEDEKKENQKEQEKDELDKEAQKELDALKLAKINKIKEQERKKYDDEILRQIKEKELLDNYKINVPEINTNVIVTSVTPTIKTEELTVSYEVMPKDIIQEVVKEEVVMVEEPVREVIQESIEEPVEEAVEESMDVIDNVKVEEKTLNNNFIKFIVINTNKKELYKKYLDKITSVDKKIKLCRNEENNIEVFVGPFENNEREKQLAVFNYVLKYDLVEALDFTQEEFDKRCNY